jgi:signal transduction histidine kinase
MIQLLQRIFAAAATQAARLVGSVLKALAWACTSVLRGFPTPLRVLAAKTHWPGSAGVAIWPGLRYLAWLACLVSVLLQAQGALAQDLTLKRFSLEDQGGVLSIEQASQALAYQPMNEALNKGATASVYWIKMVVQPQDAARPLHLRLMPTALDSVELFIPASAQGSDFVRLELHKRSSQAHSPLVLAAGVDTLFLRVQTTGLMLVSPKLMTDADSYRSDEAQARLTGGFVTLFLVLLFFTLWTAIQRRDPSIYFFGLNLVAIIFQLLMHFNLPAEWVEINSDTSKFLTRASNLLNVFTLGLFINSVFHHYGAAKPFKLIAKSAAYLIGGLLSLYLLTRIQYTLTIGLILGILYTFLALPLVVYLFYKSLSPKSGIYLGITALLISAMALLVTYFEIYNSAFKYIDAVDLIAWRSLLIVPFTIWFIVIESQQARSESAQALVIRTEALTRAESEKNRRLQQTEFLSMLLHELKTPLTIIQFATAHLNAPMVDEEVKRKKVLNILQSVEDINYIIERCVEFDGAAQDTEPDYEFVKIKDLMNEVLRPIDTTRLIFDLEKDQVIFSDFQFLRIILTNLLTNAIKYSKSDTAVELTIERIGHEQGDQFVFTVINEIGTDGVPEAEKVFSRYYRAEGAKKKPGVGLGLWLSQTLAQKISSRLQFSTDGLRVQFLLIVPDHGSK